VILRVGVTLPQFRHDADMALAAAQRAEELGLDGIFAFDHLWPMGSPDRPILAALPFMGALVAETRSLVVGSLVMRVGLVPDEVLVQDLCGLHRLSGGRFIAGLGTGDRLSAAENDAFGLAYPPARERRASLERCAAALVSAGVPVWVGTGAVPAPATVEVAARVGAAVNLWESDPVGASTYRSLAPRPPLAAHPELEFTWGGPTGPGVEAVLAVLRRVADAGATWAVCGWPESLEDVAEARQRLNRPDGDGHG
jgi:hypothetical protein